MRTLKVEGQDVVLDDNRLAFNEATVNEFLDEFGKNLSYYCGMYAEAEKELGKLTEAYELKLGQRYDHYKGQGCTEKQADVRAKQEVEVQAAWAVVLEHKSIVSHLKGHIKAWDKACDCALNRANTLRKEMDKLNADIYRQSN